MPELTLPLSAQLRPKLIEMLFEAAKKLRAYKPSELIINYKQDNSPYTNADLDANTYLTNELLALDLNIPIVSEEGEIPEQAAEQFWLLDPLDGTQNFMKGSSSYCINLALIDRQAPVMGLLCHPHSMTIYATFADEVVWRYIETAESAQMVLAPTILSPSAVTSKRNNSYAELAPLLHNQEMPMQAVASAYKYFHLLEGKASHYPCAVSIMEWDTAAGDALLRAHGGGISLTDSSLMLYGKPGFVNPPFLARAGS